MSTRKAYRNGEFLDSREARAIRVLAEYLEPEARFDETGVHDTIVFYGSARIGARDAAEAGLEAARAGAGDVDAARTALEMSRFYEATRELARRFSEWSARLEAQPGRYVVCTGGGPGIMEAANRGAHDAGALSAGLTISIPLEEFENPYVSKDLAFNFHYFFMRKFWFTYLAKAVVVMPGGFGTFDELFELMTLIQTLKMKKRPPIVLFGKDFWSEVLNLDALVRYGTISARDLELFHRTDSVDDAFDFVTGELERNPPEARGPSL